MSDRCRQSIYLPPAMLAEIQEAARRQDRALSWILQKAWKIARVQIKALPDAIDDEDDDDTPEPVTPQAPPPKRARSKRSPSIPSLDRIVERADARRRAIGQADAPEREPFDDIDLDPDAPDDIPCPTI